MDEIYLALQALGIPVAYDHFAEGESPAPPFICYLAPRSHNFFADDVVFEKIERIAPARSPGDSGQPRVAHARAVSGEVVEAAIADVHVRIELRPAPGAELRLVAHPRARTKPLFHRFPFLVSPS